ncbi:hypothetical protein F4805DRAFT_446991 [Annulohypoxylon moriforme]|nr:hypothetical protein F4805DRAFT_446991 [Annulohypoxylon moriforme]
MKIAHIIVSTQILRATASSTFQPSCSIPPESTNLVLAANVRGTFDILWTSLFTLITCCWTVQHLNVPRQPQKPEDSEQLEKGWRKGFNNIIQIIQRSLLSILPKLKWMLLTLLVPEFLVGKSLQDRRLARKFIADMVDRNGLADDVCHGLEWAQEHWKMTHGFYVGMGGFAIKTNKSETPIFLNHRSLLYVCGVTRTADVQPPEVRVTADKEAIVKELPQITEEEIKDKSKSDLFIKIITIGQLCWFIIQAIARGVRGLAIPQLEIAVLAYAACTIITFFLCLSKPKDVQTPTMLLSKSSEQFQILSIRDRNELARLHPVSWFKITLRSQRFFGAQKPPRRTEIILSPIPNDARYSHKPAMSIFFGKQALLTHMDDGFFLVGMIFGAIHCASWYSEFPTTLEQLLWRVSSVATATLLPAYYILLLIDIHHGWKLILGGVPVLGFILTFFEMLAILGYILARLYLVVEIFRSLCFQPSSAFITTWSSEIPHVA